MLTFSTGIRANFATSRRTSSKPITPLCSLSGFILCLAAALSNTSNALSGKNLPCICSTLKSTAASIAGFFIETL